MEVLLRLYVGSVVPLFSLCPGCSSVGYLSPLFDDLSRLHFISLKDLFLSVVYWVGADLWRGSRLTWLASVSRVRSDTLGRVTIRVRMRQQPASWPP